MRADTEVRYLKGVGPQRAAALAGLGVHCVRDLLEHFPHRYEFLPGLTLMKDLEENREATVLGEVVRMQYRGRTRPPFLEAYLEDDTGQCRLVWFHGGYLRDQLLPGDKLAAWGKVVRYKDCLQLTNPQWFKPRDAEELFARQGQARAVYPAGGDISTTHIQNIMAQSLQSMLTSVEEWYPGEMLRKRKLLSRREALAGVHQPRDKDQIARARRRLAYDELFLMELGMALRREQIEQTQQARPLPVTQKLDERIRRLFPFSFTNAQDKVIGEVCDDLKRNVPMNRLLQGDVGSGKTVVALYAILLAVGHHRQAAILAPTEILAAQHFEHIERYLQHSRVRRCLLRGGLAPGERNKLLEQIKNGEMDIVVGTQALLQEDVTFRELAVVVVDEQHKFGVRQRQSLRGKDLAPHYLVMTATPIPRTMAMTVFGDLDVSVIDALPPGRQPITTYFTPPEKRKKAYTFIRDKIKQGQQVYFVCPRLAEGVEETPLLPVDDDIPTENDAGPSTDKQKGLSMPPASAISLKTALAEHRRLQEEIFPEFRVGLLHGQMSSGEKKQVMEAFRGRNLDILVATVVVEVGVDVPNATVMVIENAERFGLAQLHQLRGRIGRGDQPSWCLLFGQPQTEQAQRRLEIMEETASGFTIAEEDLRLRGPGQLFGTAQHGLPELKVADILNDMDLLRLARRDAQELAHNDPFLRNPRHSVLREELLHRLGEALLLVDVG